MLQEGRCSCPPMRPMARAYSHHGHGPRADLTGRIHISDFRHPAKPHLRNAAGPYIRVKSGSPGLPRDSSAVRFRAGAEGRNVRLPQESGRYTRLPRTAAVRRTRTEASDVRCLVLSNYAWFIGSPAARRAAMSASSPAVSARNWVFAQAAIVKSRRMDKSCSAASFACSG